MRRLTMVLLSIAFSFMPLAARAVPKHEDVKTAEAFAGCLWNGIGLLSQIALPLSEPRGLIIIGLLLIGLSVAVRRGVSGKWGR